MPGGAWTTEVEDTVSTADNILLSVASQAMPTAGATGDAELTGVGGGDETLAIQIPVKPGRYVSATTTAATVSKYPNTDLSDDLLGVPFLRTSQSGTADIAGGGTLSIDRPALVNNDVLVVLIGKDDDPSITPPAGWTEIDARGDTSGDDLYTGAWYRVVTNSNDEPVTYDFTNNDGGTEDFSYWIGAFGNVDTVSPIEVQDVWTFTNDPSPGPLTASAVTTENANAYALATWFVGNNDPDVTTPGAP